MNFPDDVDGDVLRLAAADGFDFSQPVEIDFNIDFNGEPHSVACGSPDIAIAEQVVREFPDVLVSSRGDELLVQMDALLSYELVVRVQATLSRIAAPFGGKCDTWGVYIKPSGHER